TLVQPARRNEIILRTRFETEPRVAALFRHIDDVREYRPARAAAAQRVRRAHGLYLAVRRIELLQCAAAEQQVAVPCTPERDARSAQGVDAERMHALRRRLFMHALQMLANEREHGRMLQVVD